MKTRRSPVVFSIVLAFFSAAMACAQDVPLHVTYVCSGEKIFIDSCNIRDLSDAATCTVAHPDKILANGLMAYSSVTRGALKALLPTCKQPSAEEVAREKAFQKKVDAAQAAKEKAANDENDAIEARAQAVISGKKPQTPEERAMARCISSGRLPASCTGNALLGAFSQMLTSVLPADPNASTSSANLAGPKMAGVFEGAGNWRIDFLDEGVLVNCSYLAPDQHFYKLDFKSGHPTITIDTTPKPLVLTLRSDGTIVGPGPFVLDGVVASGSSGGGTTPGHMETTTTAQEHTVSRDPRVSDQDLSLHPGTLTGTETTYSTTSTYVPGTSTPAHTTFSPKRVTCPALNLSSKGASVGMETMQTDLLKTMFGGDKGPPTPPGIRMHGIYAASTGFSVQFFPESAVLGCGPDAARAYPYAVIAEGTSAVIHINAPDHPLTLALKPDGSLDPGGSGPYQVHGRTITGQDRNDNMTFAPLEQTCNLAALAPSKTIPSAGGTAAMTASAAAATTATASAVNPAGLKTAIPGAPTGNAILSITSGFPPQPGTANPLAGHPYMLLRDTLQTILAKSGFPVPPGSTPFNVIGATCAAKTPDCQKLLAGINADSASLARADANGKADMPGVPPGAYFLMISTRFNNQTLYWGFQVNLQAGPNLLTLDQRNAVQITTTPVK
jgi:hypothetical protein